jgi:hypothetical protein
MLLMFDLFSLDVERMGFSIEKTDVWYWGHNRKPRLCLQLFQCSFSEFQVKVKANSLFLWISHENVMDRT